MANKMLIDATHPEETRVVVVRGNRVEEFDFESANRRQLRGNIYLAKVTRVEPSLQAAFVDYGGNRHGFLAFSEIHPDYYQIPVADRQALIAEEERAHRAAEDEVDRRAGRRHGPRASARRDDTRHAPVEPVTDDAAPAEAELDAAPPTPGDEPPPATEPWLAPEEPAEPVESAAAPASGETDAPAPHGEAEPAPDQAGAEEPEPAEPTDPASEAAAEGNGEGGTRVEDVDADGEEEEVVESVGGGDAMEEVPERMPRLRRQYKIQEVIKRRQIMLVQVVKEERGTKGAALTTYLSLAGRYSVLMPNTARGGGISRKITSAQDRKRLKTVAQDLEVPDGMGVILRTAGANRTKPEIKRDFEYLIRLWETVRDFTLKSTAPTLVYEEGSLIKRSIRDLYNKDIDEVVVAGEEAHREAKEFMRMLMPSHAKNVKPYHDAQPIFTRSGIESQLDAMFSPIVQLRSGGYIVLNQTEALVSIDVNSGRATREHHIEDTALKTNLEASEEIARQLRLRDLAGLIVIDFIDMDEKRNNRAVERRLKECLKNDRARIQVGRISHFGLMEMSRQRIRTGVLESSTEKCPYCGGTGHLRSVASVALQLLRSLEEMLIKGATHNLIVRTRAEIAIYVLNHKRAHLRDLEQRFRVAITVNADATIAGQQSFVIDKGEQVHSLEAARAIAVQPTTVLPVHDEDDADEAADDVADEVANADEDSEVEAEAEEAEDEAEPEAVHTVGRTAEPGEADRPRRRRRRRGRGRREGGEPFSDAAPRAERGEFAAQAEPHGDDHGHPREGAGEAREAAGEGLGDPERRRRRRGRRGGRRRRGRDGEVFSDAPAFEPELDSAVADFDRPPAAERPEPVASEPSYYVPPPPPPVQAEAPPPQAESPPAAAPHPAPAEPEPPRRRSTVREPAPLYFGERPAESAAPEPSPAPESIAPSPAPADVAAPGQPRRTGWWSRRFAGDKG